MTSYKDLENKLQEWTEGGGGAYYAEGWQRLKAERARAEKFWASAQERAEKMEIERNLWRDLAKAEGADKEHERALVAEVEEKWKPGYYEMRGKLKRAEAERDALRAELRRAEKFWASGWARKMQAEVERLQREQFGTPCKCEEWVKACGLAEARAEQAEAALLTSY